MKNSILTLIFIGLSITLLGQHHFQDITTQVGIYGQNGLGHAVAWGDINNNGFQDLAFSNQDGTDFWLYKNTNGSFENITSAAGLSGNNGEKILFIDVNGDEWVDLVLQPRSGTQKIYLNNGDETFEIMTGSGVNKDIRLAADYNNDGWIDLLSTSDGNCTIFYNQEGTGFTSEYIGNCYDILAAVSFDYNQDGWQDIYLSTYGDNENILYKNMGDGNFENTTEVAGLSYPFSGHGVTVADYNNDGLVDVYVGSYSSSVNCKLFKNNGDATFSDVTTTVGINGHHDTRTVSFADYNNDGWVDIFSSHHDFYTYSNTLQRNDEGEDFVDTASEMGISGEFLGDYFGVGWADFDNDGDQDLFGAGHIDKYVLWENKNCLGHYLELILQGTESNHSAVGASATLWVNGQTIKRWVHAGQGRLDSHSKRLHFGLGEALSVDSLLIEWPSGTTHFFTSNQIGIDDIWTISEDLNVGLQKTPEKIVLELFPNPAHTFFSISTKDNHESYNILVYNIQSQVIIDKKHITTHQKIKLPSSIKAGVYFVDIYNDNGKQTIKMIVE